MGQLFSIKMQLNALFAQTFSFFVFHTLSQSTLFLKAAINNIPFP